MPLNPDSYRVRTPCRTRWIRGFNASGRTGSGVSLRCGWPGAGSSGSGTAGCAWGSGRREVLGFRRAGEAWGSGRREIRLSGRVLWAAGCPDRSRSRWEGRVQMAVFVLVHGAWGGAHGFRKVRGPLREAGHEVFTPSLTGIGERAHLTSPQVSLTTHIADVVNAVWYEDLSDIVLLGYSYGGFVVT